ncbi:DUF2058 domain-containing protein [Zoogloea sp.]|uniref:DUF2058 domain-containing protein n=1 Tax=Zoogloea sp. TaxID=49181 RepID=UPI0026013714|nr:DUF2058 domain-containing protein [Zoogloea sp.]MCK6373769.1 DUF2058 domain-containing protein [Zoogloea sp.]MCK6396356.1 DUF2058 domain-containing protein [Zoogloea sp.]
MASLQDQFMKAGLVSKGKAKQLNQDKSRQQKLDRKAGVQTVDEAKLAAQEIQRQQAERARELNAQRDAAARQKAIEAQIVQMIQQHKQAKLTRGAAEVAYNYTHDNKIKRMFVSAQVRDHIAAGHLVIVCQGESAELLPRAIGNKIAERDPARVVYVKQAEAPAEDDPYADFKVPDDLMW